MQTYTALGFYVVHSSLIIITIICKIVVHTTVRICFFTTFFLFSRDDKLNFSTSNIF